MSKQKTQKLTVPVPGKAMRLQKMEFEEVVKSMIDGVVTFEQNADLVQAALEHKARAPPENLPPEPCVIGPPEPDREREAINRKLATLPDPRNYQTVVALIDKSMESNLRGRTLTESAQTAGAGCVIEVISRQYNAAFLRTPNKNERGCAMGSQCIVKLKYGHVFREFVTPAQQEAFATNHRRADPETFACLPCCRSFLDTEREFSHYAKMSLNAVISPPPFCNLFEIDGEYDICDAIPPTEEYPLPIVRNKWHAYTVVEDKQNNIFSFVESGYAVGKSIKN